VNHTADAKRVEPKQQNEDEAREKGIIGWHDWKK
jgi:hypothetical protein